VEAEFRAEKLDQLQLLVDIGLAKTELRRTLDTLDYSNLDDNALFKNVNTTTEHVAYHIHGLLASACRDGRLGDGGRAVTGLKILLRESPNAWAAYEAPIG
jgi:6-pyruvoyl-tetrahydropterin synthase